MNADEAAPQEFGERARPNNGEYSGDIMSLETYYEILGIGENADDDAVKQAFRDLAKHFHPDRNPNDDDAERQFKRINAAYEGLKDAARRQAYDEWLEFAHKREKVKRTQWGRLAALVFLLLLGPSAVLYWAVVVADIPFFAESVDKITGTSTRRETSLPPPKPERRQPLSPAVEPAPEPEPRNASQSVPASQSAPSPASSPVPASVKLSPTARNSSPGADKTTTQSLPAARPTLTELLGAAERETVSGTTTEAVANRVSSLPDSDLGQDAAPQGDNARATAKMLARLKEPDGAAPAAVPSETVPPGADNAAPPVRDGLPPDAFADCDGCPLISAAGSNESLGGNGRAAISLGEITLADWDGCVADRTCLPYDRPARGTRRETIVEVAQRDAETFVSWLSATSGKNYRHVMSPRRREATAPGCNGAKRNSSGWEWLDDNSARNCPPQSASENGPDAPRSFRVFRKMLP
jgi:cytoskeletal protein RodZ